MGNWSRQFETRYIDPARDIVKKLIAVQNGDDGCGIDIAGCNLNVCVDTGRDEAEIPWDSNSPISRLYSKRSCYIESGQIIDETNNYFDSECNAEWDPTTLTDGDKCNDEALNQGRVYSMLNWGIVTSGGLDSES